MNKHFFNNNLCHLALHEEFPVDVVPLDHNRYLCRFARAAFGFAETRLPVDTAWLGEVRTPDGVNRTPGGCVYAGEAELSNVDGKIRISPPAWKPPEWMDPTHPLSPPEEFGTVAPFRYLELHGCSRPPKPEEISRFNLHVRVEEPSGCFESDDPGLNDVWHICRHTLIATSFCGCFVDGNRERRPYEADAYINQLGFAAVSADPLPARITLDHLLDHPTWPSEWQYHLALCAHHYLMHYGDKEWTAKNFDRLAARADFARLREDGLLETLGCRHKTGVTIGDIVDWPPVERFQFEFRTANIVVNAIACRAWRCMAEMARHIGRPEDAHIWSNKADALAASINRLCWDPVSKAYLDGVGPRRVWVKDGTFDETEGHTPCTSHSPHAQLFALACGVVPAERIPDVVEKLRDADMPCSVYAAQFLLEGVYLADESDLAYDLLTSTGKRSWLHMVRDLGATMTLEAWDPSLKANIDWNHAWGSAPGNLIPRFLVGAQPLEPGWTRCRIAPRPGPLSAFLARLPTPLGPVEVEFDKTAGFLRVRLPEGCVAEIDPSCVGLPVGDVVGEGIHTFRTP